MKHVLAASSLATALSAGAMGARADPTDASLTYAARSEFTSDTGTRTLVEFVTLRQSQKRSFVTVAGVDGAVVSLPTQVLPDGEIVANAADPAVSCYNTAKALLAPSDPGDNSHGAVLVRFGSGIVRIAVPLRPMPGLHGVQGYRGSGSASFVANIADAETPVRMLTDARIVATDGNLREAVIVTTTSMGTSGKLVGRIMCSLKSSRSTAPMWGAQRIGRHAPPAYRANRSLGTG